MKYFITTILATASFIASSQSIVGTWQLSEEKTCFQSSVSETIGQSDVEKELSSQMGSSSTKSVARLIRFNEKGTGEEGVFRTGKKKGSSMEAFRFKIQGNELQFVDKKSGMVTQRFVIDELTESSLRIHDAMKECETKAFIKIK